MTAKPVVLARHELLSAAVQVIAAERRLGLDDASDVRLLKRAEDALDLAAQEVVLAIEAHVPVWRRPKGWHPA